MAAIDVDDLHKSYGELAAVQGVSFEIAEGEVFCLLGPNGAGKTTTVEILEGYRTRSSGHVRVLGLDPDGGGRKLRERIGIVLQETGIEPDLTVAEVLAMYGSFYPRRRTVDEVVELVELGPKRDARVRTLSGGQRRRLDLALALVGDPELLFLDEPTTGFDPSARRNAWSTIRALCQLGKTVVLTTHYLDEAQALADRVAVMRAGRIVAAGTPDELGGRDAAPSEIRFFLPEGMTPGALPDLGDAELELDSAGRALLITTDGVRMINRLTGWALERGLPLRGLTVTKPTLEDVYLHLTETEEEALR